MDVMTGDVMDVMTGDVMDVMTGDVMDVMTGDVMDVMTGDVMKGDMTTGDRLRMEIAVTSRFWCPFRQTPSAQRGCRCR